MADRDLKLREWKDDELRQAAQHVRALLDSPGWAVVRRLLAIKRETLVRVMTNPSLPGYEQLAAYSGEIRGLAAAEKAADDVIKAAQEREAEIAKRVEEAQRV